MYAGRVLITYLYMLLLTAGQDITDLAVDPGTKPGEPRVGFTKRPAGLLAAALDGCFTIFIIWYHILDYGFNTQCYSTASSALLVPSAPCLHSLSNYYFIVIF